MIEPNRQPPVAPDMTIAPRRPSATLRALALAALLGGVVISPLQAAEGANDLEDLIRDLNEQMLEAAGELKFELAARLRDEVSELKRELRQMEKASHLG